MPFEYNISLFHHIDIFRAANAGLTIILALNKSERDTAYTKRERKLVTRYKLNTAVPCRRTKERTKRNVKELKKIIKYRGQKQAQQLDEL